MHRKIEIKLRLEDKAAHAKLAAYLEKDLQATHHQENYFFDGAKQEITSTRTVLRCRFYNTDQRALLTMKVSHGKLLPLQAEQGVKARRHVQGKQELVGGIGRGSELEADIDPAKGRQLLKDPTQLLGMHIDFVHELQK